MFNLLYLFLILSPPTQPGVLPNHWIFLIDASGTVVNTRYRARSYKVLLQDSLLNILNQLKPPIDRYRGKEDFTTICYFGILPNSYLREADTTDTAMISPIQILKKFRLGKDYLHFALPPGHYSPEIVKTIIYPPSPHYHFTFLSIAEPSVLYYLREYSPMLKGEIANTFLVIVTDDEYNDYACYHEIRFLKQISGDQYLRDLQDIEDEYSFKLLRALDKKVKGINWGIYIYKIENARTSRFFTQYRSYGINWIKEISFSVGWIKPKVSMTISLSPYFMRSLYSELNIKRGWLDVRIMDPLTGIDTTVNFCVKDDVSSFHLSMIPIEPVKKIFKKYPDIHSSLDLRFLVYDHILGSQLHVLRAEYRFKHPKALLVYLGKLFIVISLIFIFIWILINLYRNILIIHNNCYKSIPLKLIIPGIGAPINFDKKVYPLEDSFNCSIIFDCNFEGTFLGNRISCFLCWFVFLKRWGLEVPIKITVAHGDMREEYELVSAKQKIKCRLDNINVAVVSLNTKLGNKRIVIESKVN